MKKRLETIKNSSQSPKKIEQSSKEVKISSKESKNPFSKVFNVKNVNTDSSLKNVKKPLESTNESSKNISVKFNHDSAYSSNIVHEKSIFLF